MAVVRRSLLAILLSVSAVLLLATPATLAAAPGNVAACYSPMHSQAYPLGREALNMDSLKSSMDDDFALMSKHITHVRTYYSQFFGIQVAPIAAKHGLKLYLGVYMTSEAWGTTEIDAAVEAARMYPDTVEAIIVGNENLHTGASAAAILAVVDQIRARVGATPVKFGTVQRITEYVDATYDAQTKQLEASLDILGVNIYPFFDPNFDAAKPTELLTTLWNRMATKFDVRKMRLTETGFPTAGPSSAEAPNVWPSLETSFAYYEALRQWIPEGAEATPKFWFGMFDRRPDDNTMGLEFEKHFGFYTHTRETKRAGYPLAITDAENPVPMPAPAPAPQPEPTQAPAPAPAPQPEPTQAPAPVPAPQPEPTQAPQPEPMPAPQPEVTQAPAPAPAPAPVPEMTTASPDSGAATTTEPVIKPTPSPTWMDVNADADAKPTPAPSSNDKPTPAPSSIQDKPTPAPSSNSKPTPAPSSNSKPTPAPTTTKLRGSDSSDATSDVGSVSLVTDKEVSSDADANADATTPTSTTVSPATAIDSPSADASAKVASSSSLVQPSRVLLVASAVVAAMAHLM